MPTAQARATRIGKCVPGDLVNGPLSLVERMGVRRAWHDAKVRSRRYERLQLPNDEVIPMPLCRVLGAKVTPQDTEVPVRHIEAHPHLHRLELREEGGGGLVDTEEGVCEPRLLLGEQAHVHVPRVVRLVAVANVCPPLLPREELLANAP